MKGMTATKLRLVLSVVIFITIVGAVTGFYFAYTKMSEYATSISHLNAQAQTGDDDIKKLESLDAKMQEQAEVIKKARSIVAQSQQYRYQDQIVGDLSRLANNNGVVITQFSFASSGTKSAAPSVAESPAAPVPSPGDVPATSGLKSETVTVTFKSPLSYDNLLNFIKAIEQNPLKMQIARVSIAKGDGTTVSSDTFTIEVYVR